MSNPTKRLQCIGKFGAGVKTVNGVGPDENGNVAIPDGVDLSGATVGQMIVVKAVDENGKPTKWKAVERTHYEDGETVKQLDEKFIPDTIARKTDIPESVEIPPATFYAVYGSTTYAEIETALAKGQTVYANCKDNVIYAPLAYKSGTRYYFKGINNYGIIVTAYIDPNNTWGISTQDLVTSVPVKKVNGKTGNVNLTAADVGALSADTDINAIVDARLKELGLIT